MKKDIVEKIQNIAEKCLDCKLCMKECVMLNNYTNSPKELFQEYMKKGYMEMPKEIAYSCNMCNQCTMVCPKDLDLKDVFMDMRKEYVKANGGKSPMKGHKAVEVHQYLGYTKLFNTTVKADKKIKYLFYPGCSLSSYSPQHVEKIFRYLNERFDGEVGALLTCCGKPLKAMGEEERFQERLKGSLNKFKELEAEKIVVACQSCYKIFSEYAEQEVVSLWTFLGEIGVPKESVGIGKNSDVVFNIHDSCSTRDVPEIHEGVRKIIGELGYKVEELKHSKGNTRCCGLGGMVAPAMPKVAQEVVERRCEESTTGHMISYCGGCREAMERGGLDSLHILDLVFGETYLKKMRKIRSISPIKQWYKRYQTKKLLVEVGE